MENFKVENADEIFIEILEDPEDTTGIYMPCPAILEYLTDYTWCKPVYSQQGTTGGIDAALSLEKHITLHLEFHLVKMHK